MIISKGKGKKNKKGESVIICLMEDEFEDWVCCRSMYNVGILHSGEDNCYCLTLVHCRDWEKERKGERGRKKHGVAFNWNKGSKDTKVILYTFLIILN